MNDTSQSEARGPDESTVTEVTLLPSGHTFTCLPGHSLLESALKAGLSLPFRCADGSCGDCRARVVSGNALPLRHADFPLPEKDRLQGICLTCSVTANSAITLEISETASAADIPHQSLKAKLCSQTVTDELAIVCFKFIRGTALNFLPGQSVDLTLPDNTSYSVPIASCPCNAQTLEFHLPLDNRDGAESCSSDLAEKILTLKRNDRVAVEGPTGRFTLPMETENDVWLFAQGIGFAPVQGIVEQILNREPIARTTLFWASTDSLGHYRHNQCRAWQDAFDEFSYIPLDGTEQLKPTESSLGALLEAHNLSDQTEPHLIYLSGSTAFQQLVSDCIDGAGFATQPQILTTTGQTTVQPTG